METPIKKGYDLINRRRKQWMNEEEVRHAWMKGIEEVLQVDLDAERARRDSSYNNVVIEFKGPGLFRGSEKSQKFIEATQERLLKYISRLAAEQGIDEQDYIGIAIDGEHISFAQVRDGKIVHLPLMPCSITAFQMVIDALRANFRRAITSENLIEDFGHLSNAGCNLMQALSNALTGALEASGNRKIKMLFEEWMALYGQAADLSIQQRKKINGSLGFDFSGPVHINLSAKLFVAHTFHSLLMKLIVAEIVAAHGMASSPSLIHELLAIEKDEALLDTLRTDIEQGGFFNATGLHGFVEEAIFSWYQDAAGKKSIRTVSRSTFKNRLKGAPFFAIYNVGRYTFSPYKVIWAEMTGDFAAAVMTSGNVPGMGKRVYVPDHKLYFADFDQPEPAYYLCGLLHSQTVKQMIEAHNVATNMGDIFKHINLPKFDELNENHLMLAALVKQAHQEHDGNKRANIVTEVRMAAAQLIETEIAKCKQSI